MKKAGDMNMALGENVTGFSGNGIKEAAKKGNAGSMDAAKTINREAKMGALIEDDKASKKSLVSGVGSMNKQADDFSLIK